MKKLLFISSLALALAACSGSTSDSAPESVQAAIEQTVPLKSDTRLAAVLVYADWCGSCKVLDPKLTEAKAEGPIDGLQHFVLDYTARDDAAFFASADALGIGEPVRAKLADTIKTGILLLVDVDDGTIVGDLRKELSVAQIRSAMKSAAAGA